MVYRFYESMKQNVDQRKLTYCFVGILCEKITVARRISQQQERIMIMDHLSCMSQFSMN